MVDAIYIHIPFCIKKCNYCDFHSFASIPEERKKYAEYVRREIELYPKMEYDTVYFGGGTPSLLESEDVKNILSELQIKDGAEVTMEVNPRSVNLEKLKALRAMGINRLSIGLQSMDEKYLKLLGRVHSKEEGVKTYLDAREAGFKNISLDLMFSLPGQTLEEVEQDLDRLLELRPEHFSIYSLIWEEGTPFFDKLMSGELQETDNDLEADMYELIIKKAKEAGYVHYEISNFSLPGYEARHNSKYWENREYIGIGLGASGYFEGIRYKNLMKFDEYYGSIDSKKLPILEREEVTSEDRDVYSYILGLRLLEKGVKIGGPYEEECQKLLERGELVISNGRYVLSHSGLMRANDIFNEFI
jgi:oxygen-independent coproporphyrinogen-3 oxidase